MNFCVFKLVQVVHVIMVFVCILQSTKDMALATIIMCESYPK